MSVLAPPLTPNQQAALDAIRAHLRETGRPPTQAELAATLGKSPATARQYLRALARKSRIKLWPGYARGISLLEASQ